MEIQIRLLTPCGGWSLYRSQDAPECPETLSLREGSRFLRGTQGYSLSRPGVKDGIS